MKRKLSTKRKRSGSTSARTKTTKRKTKTTGSKSRVGGFAQARKINEKNQREADRRRAQPFRFRLKIGDEGKVILLDKEPYFLYEHQWQGSRGYFDQREVCLKTWGEPCPLCQKLDKEGTYELVLTCIDTRKYTDSKGVKHKFSRKLLVVKPSMISKFERLFRKQGKDKTFRGIVITLARDNDKGQAIGDSLEYETTISEAKIAKYGDEAKMVDYEKAFPRITEAQMRKMHDMSSVPGASDVSDDDELDDEIPF